LKGWLYNPGAFARPRRRQLDRGCAARAARGSRRRPSGAARAACGRRQWIWRRIAADGGAAPAGRRRGHSGARWRAAWTGAAPPGAASGAGGRDRNPRSPSAAFDRGRSSRQQESMEMESRTNHKWSGRVVPRMLDWILSLSVCLPPSLTPVSFSAGIHGGIEQENFYFYFYFWGRK